MFFPAFNLETTYVLLTVLIMARVVLYGSNLATFISLSLLSSLSFVFFESYFAFSPLVFLLLKNPFLAFFTWLKTFVSHSKECENKEKESEVLFMKGKQEPSSTFENNPDSVCDQDQAENPKRPSFVKMEDDRFVLDFPAPKPEILKGIVGSFPDMILALSIVGYSNAFFRYCVPALGRLYDIYGHTPEGRLFVDRRAMAVGSFMVLFFSVAKFSGDGLTGFVKDALRPVLLAATPIEPSAENKDTLKALDQRLEEALDKHLYLKQTLSGEFVRVSPEEVSSLFIGWFKRLDVLVQEGKIKLDLEGFERLPQTEKSLLIEEYNYLPEEYKEIIKKHFKVLYEKAVEAERLSHQLAPSEIIDSNEEPTLSYREQGNLLPAPKPPSPFFKRIKAADLQDPENPNRSIRESIEQIEAHSSPKGSYDEFSTTISPDLFERDLQNQGREKLRQAQALIAQSSTEPESSTLDQNPNQGDWSTLSERYGSPGNSPWSVPVNLSPFSAQQSNPTRGTQDVGTNSVKDSDALDTHNLLSRDKSLSKSDHLDSPGSSPSFAPGRPDVIHSPLEDDLKEELSKAIAAVWVCCGLSAFTLVTASRIPWIILRKLNYTQNLVNKMSAKGVPNFLLSWIRHPRPGLVDGKPFFLLMVAILVGNALVLYTLVKLIYLTFP